jgi:hypothetical protein
MPGGVDLSAMFRAASSVSEYILIGERDSSVCGCAEKTWGGEAEADGFARVELQALSALQVCRSDSSTARGFSATVSFRRRIGSANVSR